MVKSDRRFYEPLALLQALDQVQGERIHEDPIESEDGPIRDGIQQRRETLKFLCAMCDYRKGGDTVTAAAVQKTPSGPVYWLSSSENVHNKIMPFLRETLNLLVQESTSISNGSDSRLQERLLTKFLAFNRKRLHSTLSLLQRNIDQVFEPQRGMILRMRADDKKDYEHWLQPFQRIIKIEDSAAWQELCQDAYDARRLSFMDKNSSIYDQGNPSLEVALHIRHHIGRLANPLRAANYISAKAFRMRSMFEDFKIKPVISGRPFDQPSVSARLTLDDIASRMLPRDSPDLEVVRAGLAQLDRIADLRNEVVKRLQRSTFKPKVHAELAVLEAVHDANIDYYDDDKFVACSKGACFCCYHYISCHPGGFAKPSSHNKIWLNWRVPDLPPMFPNSEKHKREMLYSLTAKVRFAVMEKIQCQSGRSRYRADSSTGITPSVMSRAVQESYSDNDPEEDLGQVSGGNSLGGAISSDDDEQGGGVSLLGAHLRATTFS